MDKIFLELGNNLINVNAVAFITPLANGDLRLTTTVRQKEGQPHTFLIKKEHVEDFKGQLSPWIAIRAGNVPTGEAD